MPRMLLALRFANPDVSQRISPVGWWYLFGAMFVIFDFCGVHVLSSGLAPRAALGGQNFSVRSVRARGWFFGFIHLLIFEHIQNHSNVCAKVNSDIVSDDFWCVAGHRMRCTPLAQLPLPPSWSPRQRSSFRQGLGRMSVLTAECFVGRTARTVIYIYIILYNIIYMYKYICSIQILQSCTFLAQFLFQQCFLRSVSSGSWAVGPWLRHGIFLRVTWMSKEGDIKGETLRKNGRIWDEKNVKRKIC